jgi:hypothetical protein
MGVEKRRVAALGHPACNLLSNPRAGGPESRFIIHILLDSKMLRTFRQTGPLRALALKFSDRYANMAY